MRLLNIDGRTFTVQKCSRCPFNHECDEESFDCSYPIDGPMRIKGYCADGFPNGCPLKEGQDD